MYPVSGTNTHHDITDLVNHGVVTNTKTWRSQEWNITFLWYKKIRNMCLSWHTLRSYHFVAEETLKEGIFFAYSYFHINIADDVISKNICKYWSIFPGHCVNHKWKHIGKRYIKTSLDFKCNFSRNC